MLKQCLSTLLRASFARVIAERLSCTTSAFARSCTTSRNWSDQQADHHHDGRLPCAQHPNLSLMIEAPFIPDRRSCQNGLVQYPKLWYGKCSATVAQKRTATSGFQTSNRRSLIGRSKSALAQMHVGHLHLGLINGNS
jgi:hypothetical protein